MTSSFTTPFRPRVKSRAVKVPRDLLPLDPTNASIGISEREIKTEDDEAVCMVAQEHPLVQLRSFAST